MRWTWPLGCSAVQLAWLPTSGTRPSLGTSVFGLLLREATSDPTLHAVAAIFLDEAHERTLSDYMLLHDMLQVRPYP